MIPALVVSDIDGTLLDPAHRLTPRALAAVAALGRACVGFTLVSARPAPAILPFLPELGVQLPVAALNGAVLVAPDGRVILAHALPARLASEALDMIARAGMPAWAFTEDRWLVQGGCERQLGHEVAVLGVKPDLVDSFQPWLGRLVKLMAICHDSGRLAALERNMGAHIGGQLCASRSHPSYLGITASAANKGTAVTALAAIAGTGLERVMVLGDMANDVPMFEVAGLAVAMGNANAQVQGKAHHVTASNAGEGFALAIERHVLAAFSAPP